MLLLLWLLPNSLFGQGGRLGRGQLRGDHILLNFRQRLARIGQQTRSEATRRASIHKRRVALASVQVPDGRSQRRRRLRLDHVRRVGAYAGRGRVRHVAILKRMLSMHRRTQKLIDIVTQGND